MLLPLLLIASAIRICGGWPLVTTDEAGCQRLDGDVRRMLSLIGENVRRNTKH